MRSYKLHCFYCLRCLNLTQFDGFCKIQLFYRSDKTFLIAIYITKLFCILELSFHSLTVFIYKVSVSNVSQSSRLASREKSQICFFAAACTSQNIPCAGLGPKEPASADPTVDVGPACVAVLPPAAGQGAKRSESFSQKMGCAHFLRMKYFVTACHCIVVDSCRIGYRIAWRVHAAAWRLDFWEVYT